MKLYVILAACLQYSMATPTIGIDASTGTTYPITTPITTTTYPTTTSFYGCPDGWVDGEHLGCYLFLYQEKRLSWLEAHGVCEQYGAFLAEVKSEAQHNFIESLAIIEESLTGVNSWWIGLTDTGHEERWVWSHTLSEVSFTSWIPGHPNTSPGNQDDCVSISLEDHFHWKDVPCSQNSHSSPAPICQMGLVPETTTAPAPTTTTFQGCQSGWSQYQNSCFKMFAFSYWSEARDYCRDIGAELASLHSQEENDFAYNLASGYSSGNVWIGGTDERGNGSWEWVDGSAWNFTNWLSGQPDLNGDDSVAMDISEYGKWRDLGTSEDSRPFLCKMY